MRKLDRFIVVSLLSGALVGVSPGDDVHAASQAKTERLSTETRVQLQAALQMHIDRTTVDGVYPRVDLNSGKITGMHPAAAHPMILSLGDSFVLCTDFRDAGGTPVNVDFYVKKRERGFSIFQVEFANRAKLNSLMSNGIATMLR